MRRFFSERTNIRVGSSVKLDADQTSHMRKILRLKVGDEILIFNGEKEFKAKIIKLTKTFSLARVFEIVEKLDFSHETYKDITLVQGIIKPIRFELIIEKATELGVTKFQPIHTDYSQISEEKFVKKYPRWKKIIVESAKQSERIDIPELFPPQHFKDFISNIKNYDCVFVLSIKNRKESHFIENKISREFKLPKNFSKIAVCIGPEGGFSENEYRILDQLDVDFVTISDNVLRSETAGIATIAILKYLILSFS
ncbi:MAG: ribosomal RNA small subunit methyltransferase E [Candidatus Dojkabacteria bacterium]|nr:MAG: ribosomal RNA small subunit methyltransferase E [Candidatus Dojkabacteria bacterium]